MFSELHFGFSFGLQAGTGTENFKRADHLCNYCSKLVALTAPNLLSVEPHFLKALSLHTVCRACSPEFLELVSRTTSDPHQWRTTQVDPPPTHGIAIPAAEVGSKALCVRGL